MDLFKKNRWLVEHCSHLNYIISSLQAQSSMSGKPNPYPSMNGFDFSWLETGAMRRRRKRKTGLCIKISRGCLVTIALAMLALVILILCRVLFDWANS